MSETDDESPIDKSLLCCPFCGGSAHLHDYGSHARSRFTIMCTRCAATGPGGRILTEQCTVDSWNRRTGEPPSGPALARSDAFVEAVARLQDFRDAGGTPESVIHAIRSYLESTKESP